MASREKALSSPSNVKGHPEKELLLGTAATVSIGAWGPTLDRFRHAQVIGHLIDLGLEEVRYGLKVCTSISILDEETKVVLISIRGANHGEMPQLGVMVEHGHAHALLEVRGCRDLLQLLWKQPLSSLSSIRVHKHKREYIQRSPFQQVAWKNDPGAVTQLRIKRRENPSDGRVSPCIASQTFESVGEVFQDGLHTEVGGHSSCEILARRIRFLLGQDESRYLLDIESTGEQSQYDARIDATADADDRSTAPHDPQNLTLKKGDDPIRLQPRINLEFFCQISHRILAWIPIPLGEFP